MSGEIPTGSVAEVVAGLGDAFGQVGEAYAAVQALKERVVDAQAQLAGTLDGTGNQLALDALEAVGLANVEIGSFEESIAVARAAAVEYVGSIGGVLDIQGI